MKFEFNIELGIKLYSEVVDINDEELEEVGDKHTYVEEEYLHEWAMDQIDYWCREVEGTKKKE